MADDWEKSVADWKAASKAGAPLAPIPEVAPLPPAPGEATAAPDKLEPVDYAALVPDARYVQTMDGRLPAEVAPAMAWCDAMEATTPGESADALARYASGLASGH